MRIAFLGTPEFALPILEACRRTALWSRAAAKAGELVLVVAQPDRPVGRSGKPQPPATVRWARDHGGRVEQPERVKEGRLASILASVRPDGAVGGAHRDTLPPDPAA